LGFDLELVIEFGGIPKLIISHDEQFIGIQFHPEAYLLPEKLEAENPIEGAKCIKVYQFFLSMIRNSI
jgi:hypothetical protein